MRNRYRVMTPEAAHFVTSSIVAWLPVFTTAARCDILVQSLAHCRAQKGLAIYGWVILDNHFHAILAAPDLPRVLADLKRHTAQRILEQLEAEKCEWLLEQFRYRQDGKHASSVAGGIASSGHLERRDDASETGISPQ